MDNSIKFHFSGIAIILLAFSVVAVPFGMYCYTARYKFYSDATKSLFTRKDYDEALMRASENLNRGLYYQALEVLKSASDKIMKRDFACEALTSFGDLLYNTRYSPDEKIKYNDALFFYLLAGTLPRSDGNEIWRYFQIANCHKKIGYDVSAISEYQDLIKRYPQSDYVEQSKLELAYLFYNRAKFIEAKEILQDLLNNTGSEVILSKALYEMALLHMQEAASLPKVKKTTDKKAK